jgi:hypothetical protein
MIPIENTRIEGQAGSFEHFRSRMATQGFVVGANWDYNHGYLDRALDGVDKVYLRVPFVVTDGDFDGESTQESTMVELGKPFVIKHLYEEGLDEGADTGLLSSMVDQFQDPIEKDAPVEEKWVTQAKQVLKTIEESFEQQ